MAVALHPTCRALFRAEMPATPSEKQRARAASRMARFGWGRLFRIGRSTAPYDINGVNQSRGALSPAGDGRSWRRPRPDRDGTRPNRGPFWDLLPRAEPLV